MMDKKIKNRTIEVHTYLDGHMPSSAEIGLLMKLNELYQRFGLRVSECDTDFYFVSSEYDPEGEGFYYLSFPGQPTNPEAKQKYFQVLDALGLDKDGPGRKFDFPSELEDLLDHALSVAPRARFR